MDTHREFALQRFRNEIQNCSDVEELQNMCIKLMQLYLCLVPPEQAELQLAAELSERERQAKADAEALVSAAMMAVGATREKLDAEQEASKQAAIQQYLAEKKAATTSSIVSPSSSVKRPQHHTHPPPTSPSSPHTASPWMTSLAPCRCRVSSVSAPFPHPA